MPTTPSRPHHGQRADPVGGHGARDPAQARTADNPDVENEREFSRTMLESLPGVLYFYNEDGRFLRWNRNLERATGYSRDEIARLHPRDLLADEQKALVESRIQDVFTHGNAVVESLLRGKDGTTTPYYFTGSRMMFDGEPCLVGVGIDISDRKLAEQRLRTSESTLAKAQRIAKMGSWELDIASGRLEWSQALYRIFGVTPGAVPATYDTFLAAVHPEDRETVRAAQAAGFADVAPYDIEHRIVCPDGEVRWVHDVAEVDRDAAGVPVRFIGTVLDITVAKRVEQELWIAKETLEQTVAERTAELQVALVRAEAADRVKSAFLATMSHELRTPLNSILGFTGIVLHGMAGPLNDEQARQLGMVRDSARHLLELINDVLDISKIEARQMDLSEGAFDMHAVAQHVVASVGPQAEAKGLQLLASIDPAIGLRIGDRRRVQQVLLNLVCNAIKFTDRGEVRLLVDLAPMPACTDASSAAVLRIRVADTGIGIRPHDVDSLFRPFKQLDTGLSREHEGTGLGLAISSRLVELMGGVITVDSQWAEGSEFSVFLPLPTAEAP
ncbi:MAG TPA: PAS domain-containing protein [Luteimonas sp.]|nr:PAS domain-containing protein [Luteimonas sp.]